MNSFNVLDKTQSVHRDAFLEASAGTGKTFAIENIVVRLLVENTSDSVPLLLERILVVTFTKASTRDLKARIRANLEATLDHLEKFLHDKVVSEVLPDYLWIVLNKGDEAVVLAKRRIQQALFVFERAQIFTIHGFCWRMLKSYAIEAGISLAAVSAEAEEYPKTRLLQVVRDFLRTELTEEAYSPKQLNSVLKKKRSIDNLQNDVFKLVSKGLEIAYLPNVTELFLSFQKNLSQIKEHYALESAKIVADFLVYAPAYNKLTARSTKQIKPEIMEGIEKFAALFDKESWQIEDFDTLIDEGLFMVDVLSPENKQKKAVQIAVDKIHYPELLKLLKELEPIVKQARDEEALVARMARDCQKLMRHYQQQEEMIGHNDLLQQMLGGLESFEFAHKVRSCFDAVIIDEFQDTDPVQWDIFKRLFDKKEKLWKGFLYLVGDPKQSIYAFRQADIYTYLSAANILGKETWATLDTNFRSCPPLLHALNTLFLTAENLFPLPKQKENLTYRPVKAGRKGSIDQFIEPCMQFWIPQISSDVKKNLSLYELETRYFFPAIVREISHLKREEGISLRQCAILVADRYQADRFTRYLKQCGIPAFSQRGENLRNSLAVHAMRDVLKGILNYQHMSSLKLALASKVIGFRYAEMQTFDLSDRHGVIVGLCDQLRSVFVHEGAAIFFPMFLQSVWQVDGKSVLERILEQEDGMGFYREWQDLVDLLIEEQAENNLSTDELVLFLDSLEELYLDDDERLKATVDHEQEGVSILTSHLSKGLEFDVVFALGLIKRSKTPERLIPVEKNKHYCLTLVEDENDLDYRRYCEELDAEKMRQLYVALTRAKLAIYLPVDMQPRSKVLNYGEASPMDLLIARLSPINQSGNYYENLYSKISQEDGTALRHFVKSSSADIILKELDACIEVPSYTNPSVEKYLLEPSTVAVPGFSLFVQSFTSLSQGGSVSQEGVKIAEEVAPHDFICEAGKGPHLLPAGSDTGTLLHEILEHVPFAEAKLWKEPKDVITWARPFLKGTVFSEWEETIATMVFDGFKTILPGPFGGFCLSDVGAGKVYRETEFFYSCNLMKEGERFLFDTSGLQPGFLKGVIDLFFEYEGRYYLLDWKSNWLGTTIESYQEKGLLAAMEQHNYHLQAGIYAEAMRRYLRLFDKRPFEAIFGGVYYLFLRGVSATSGIHYFYPGKE